MYEYRKQEVLQIHKSGRLQVRIYHLLNYKNKYKYALKTYWYFPDISV